MLNFFMQRFKINVTADHIINGMRKNPFDCMLALAIKNDFRFKDYIFTVQSRSIVVHENTVSFPMLKNAKMSYFIDFNLHKLMKLWDEGHILHPFELILEWKDGVFTAKHGEIFSPSKLEIEVFKMRQP